MRIFILCCGPSIKYQNLLCLKGEKCISVANFFVHPLIHEISPIEHVIAPLHNPITNDMKLAYCSEANKHLPKDTTLVVNQEEREFCSSFEKNRRVGIYNKHSMPFMSVSQIALSIAMAKQPNEIYLLGCDHNWIRHVGETRHFYDESESVMSKMGWDEWLGLDKEGAVERERSCNESLFNIYKQYDAMAKQHNILIYNVTPRSRLETFPKTTLFDIFEEPTMEIV